VCTHGLTKSIHGLNQTTYKPKFTIILTLTKKNKKNQFYKFLNENIFNSFELGSAPDRKY